MKTHRLLYLAGTKKITNTSYVLQYPFIKWRIQSGEADKYDPKIAFDDFSIAHENVICVRMRGEEKDGCNGSIEQPQMGGAGVADEGATQRQPAGRSHDSDESVKTRMEETGRDEPAVGDGAGEAEGVGSKNGDDGCGVRTTGRAWRVEERSHFMDAGVAARMEARRLRSRAMGPLSHGRRAACEWWPLLPRALTRRAGGGAQERATRRTLGKGRLRPEVEPRLQAYEKPLAPEEEQWEE
ncbi:unnamed protein product [Miscanthus lutarioriparius]|uniref:Uncharacterized protein n=1 Tax=Miscanthus lutarioriparius TaxID=422564 RepID=A0A811SLK6_9POAL|nr:unnamed protein product [Miscanthus lutarioriparius]